jgi:hypothetical protein
MRVDERDEQTAADAHDIELARWTRRRARRCG